MRPAQWMLAALLIASMAAPALAQTTTGSIAGTVRDEQGGALPGTAVTLSGSTGDATNFTDDVGAYRFPILDPGVYRVRVELSGFQPYSADSIVVSIGRQLTIDVVLRIGGVTETVDVVGASPVVDVTSSGTSNTLSNELLFSIPLSRRAQDILNYAPGINDSSGYGGGDGSNALYLDGLDTRNPSTGDQYVFVNYNIIQEVQIEGLGAPAEYGGFTGAVVNTVTKSGGNRFSALFDVQWSAGGYASNNVDPGTAALYPSVAEPLKTTKLLDLTGQLGGPILRDKLFFFTSFQRYQLTYDPFGPRTKLDEVTPRINAKLTWQRSASEQLSFSFQGEDFNRTGRSNAVAGSLATTDALSLRQDSPDRLANAQWRRVFGNNTLTEVKFLGWSAHDYHDPEVPEPIHVNENVEYSGGGGYTAYFDRKRYQLNATVSRYASRFAGTHDFKFGMQVERSRVRDRSDYIGLYYYDYGGQPYLGYAYSYDQTGDSHRESFFAQDSWKINERVTINPGVRFDWVRGISPALDGRKVFETKSLAPRLGVAFDLTGKRDTVLRAFYGRYYEGVFQTFYYRVLPGLGDFITYDLTSGVPIERDRIPNGLGYRLDPDVKHPRVDEFLLAFERSLTPQVTLSVTGVWRDNKDFVGSVNPSARWVPTTVENGLTGQPLTVYNWVNQDESELDFVITNPDGFQFLDPGGGVLGTAEASRKYKALMVVLNKRLGNRWQAQASYVLSKNEGTVDPFFTESVGYGRQWENPNLGLVNAVGEFSGSRRHEFKLLASYEVPVIDVELSGYYRGISGDRYAAYQRFSTGEIDYPFASGREPYIEPRGSRVLDAEHIVDLRVEKSFLLGGMRSDRVAVYADFSNLFNSSLITDVQERFPSIEIEGSTVPFEGPAAFIEPRQATIGVRWSF